MGKKSVEHKLRYVNFNTNILEEYGAKSWAKVITAYDAVREKCQVGMTGIDSMWVEGDVMLYPRDALIFLKEKPTFYAHERVGYTAILSYVTPQGHLVHLEACDAGKVAVIKWLEEQRTHETIFKDIMAGSGAFAGAYRYLMAIRIGLPVGMLWSAIKAADGFSSEAVAAQEVADLVFGSVYNGGRL